MRPTTFRASTLRGLTFANSHPFVVSVCRDRIGKPDRLVPKVGVVLMRMRGLERSDHPIQGSMTRLDNTHDIGLRRAYPLVKTKETGVKPSQRLLSKGSLKHKTGDGQDYVVVRTPHLRTLCLSIRTFLRQQLLFSLPGSLFSSGSICSIELELPRLKLAVASQSSDRERDHLTKQERTDRKDPGRRRTRVSAIRPRPPREEHEHSKSHHGRRQQRESKPHTACQTLRLHTCPPVRKGHSPMTQEGNSPVTLGTCGKPSTGPIEGHSPVISGSLPSDPSRKYSRRDNSPTTSTHYSLGDKADDQPRESCTR